MSSVTNHAINQYAIEVGVPIPPKATKKGEQKWRLFPFERLLVGESFFVPAAAVRGIAVYCAHATRSLNRTFTCRQMSDGTRVWRTE